MKIPKKIKIGGKTYEVLLQNLREKTGSGDFGMSQCARQKIWISNEMHPEQQEATFLHEIIEVVNSENNLGIGHQIIQTLSEALYQVIKDNKLLK